jgi:putative membrane protein
VGSRGAGGSAEPDRGGRAISAGSGVSLRNGVVRLFVNSVALWVAAEWVDGIELATEFWPILFVAAVFGILNALLKPLLLLVSLPFVLLTLGLFTFVINALLLLLTARIVDALSVSGFGPALWGSLLISLVSFLLAGLLPNRKR